MVKRSFNNDLNAFGVLKRRSLCKNIETFGGVTYVYLKSNLLKKNVMTPS